MLLVDCFKRLEDYDKIAFFYTLHELTYITDEVMLNFVSAYLHKRNGYLTKSISLYLKSENNIIKQMVFDWLF